MCVKVCFAYMYVYSICLCVCMFTMSVRSSQGVQKGLLATLELGNPVMNNHVGAGKQTWALYKSS